MPVPVEQNQPFHPRLPRAAARLCLKERLADDANPRMTTIRAIVSELRMMPDPKKDLKVCISVSYILIPPYMPGPG